MFLTATGRACWPGGTVEANFKADDFSLEPSSAFPARTSRVAWRSCEVVLQCGYCARILTPVFPSSDEAIWSRPAPRPIIRRAISQPNARRRGRDARASLDPMRKGRGTLRAGARAQFFARELPRLARVGRVTLEERLIGA